MSSAIVTDTDEEMAKYDEARLLAENHPPLAAMKNKKTTYNTETGKTEILMTLEGGGYVKVGEEPKDRTREIKGYAQDLQSMGQPFDIDNFTSAGYTEDEVMAAGVVPQGQTKTGRTDPLTKGEQLLVQRSGGDLAMPRELTKREEDREGFYLNREGELKQIFRALGIDEFAARQMAEGIFGNVNSTRDLGIGLADFSPQGLFYGAEEGVITMNRGLKSGDNLTVAMGALEAGLSFAEAVPLTAAGAKGIKKNIPAIRAAIEEIGKRLNQPGDMPTVGSMGGNVGEQINKAIELFDQAKIRREGTTGRYVGGPPGLNTPQKLAALRKKVFDLTIEGAPGRFWYERSGKAILDAVGGDKVEAEKLAQAIAITSSGTPVGANFDFALQAYLQNKAGQPITTGRFPEAMSKRLTDMFNGTPWEGRKTNSFYVNLMREIEPTLSQPVTVDLWMLRAFGYKTDNPTDQQYTFIENEVNKLADELGWEPQQVQAAIWVKAKADDQGISVDKAKFDYADALEKNKMQISWESIPGRTSGHMLEMFDAPYEVQQQYHVDISKAFLDDNGNDIVAQRLGIPSPGEFEAPGYFEGKVSPGTQTELAIPKQYKGPKYGAVDPAALDLVNAYAAVRGILMKQDGVGYHRPFFDPAKKDANGVQVDIGRKFTEEETAQFAQILSKLSGHGEYNPIGATGGVRIINFDYLEFDNKEFIKLVDQALDELDLGDAEATVKYFASQNGYAGNDWSVSKNGEGYISQLRGEGRSDIQRKVRDVITELSPRIDAIDSEYQIKYGFTGNSDINAEFRTGIEPPTEP